MTVAALTIAGSDPSGGAGIQADLKTFQRRGVYGMSVLTLVTVQNTLGVTAVEPLRTDLVVAQLDAVLSDIPPAAAKTGAMGNEEIIRAVAERARTFDFPLIVDPVMISKHGAPLLAEDARVALASELLPRAFLVTPNIDEAVSLGGIEIQNVEEMGEAARRIQDLGASSVLVKGGHLTGSAVDVLLWSGKLWRFESPRVQTKHTHGTGCTYSAAITAELARGAELPVAVERAKIFITAAIASNPGLGHGFGPVNHHA